MTAALATSFPGVEVSEVSVLLRDDGTNRRARLALSYVGRPGPPTVFVKASDRDHAAVNASTGGVFHEPRLFTSGVTLPLDHPTVYYTVIDEPNLDFMMIMEDILTRGGDPRDATRPMTVNQVRSGVRNLARLHSAFWGDRFEQYPQLSWIEPFVAWRGMAAGIDIGLARVGDAIDPAVRSLTGKHIMRDVWVPFVATLATGGQTLLHGDAHIGNTYVLPGDDVGFLDWQVVRRGNPSIDLGYFLQGACTVEDRRLNERDLVEDYRQALTVDHGELPSAEEVWLRYRASTSYGLAIWLVTAASDWQRFEVSLALSERYAAAFVDLDGASALEELAAMAPTSTQ